MKNTKTGRFLTRPSLAGALLLASAPLLAQGLGVTLHTDTDREGNRQLFTHDEPDLSRTRFGAGRARSISVPRGCTATLFTRPNFRGRRVDVRDDDNDLGNTAVGYDTASLQVRCESREGEPYHYPLRDEESSRGVTLFRDRNLDGPSDTFFDDVSDLSRTRVGNRRASSIRVPRGCEAILYDRTYFRGRSTTFHDDDNNLKNTPVGEDTASSIRVRCGRYHDHDVEGQGGYIEAPPAPPRGGPGVTLFRDRDLEGPSQTFTTDEPDLARTEFGARKASSIRVPRGCIAILYEGPGFRGRRTEFRDDDRNLKNTEVGEDTASSLQVDCGGRR